MANWKAWNYKIKLVELGKNMNIYKWKKVMNHKVTGYGLAFFMPVLCKIYNQCTSGGRIMRDIIITIGI